MLRTRCGNDAAEVITDPAALANPAEGTAAICS